MQVLQCDQGSEEWIRARMGLPTSSEFASILTKGRGGAESKVRRSYMLQLAGEILTDQPCENFWSPHTQRGKDLEPEARDLYAFVTGAEPQTVGFIVNNGAGCSPDSLVGDAGMLEIKTKKPDLLVDIIDKGEFPPEHKAQCQGALWVAEREWIDIAVYWPGLPLFRQRAARDEEFIDNLADEVARFNDDLQKMVERVRAYGAPAEAAA